MFRRLLSYLPRLWANWITLLGAVITTLSGGAIVLLLAIEIATTGANTYTSTFLVLFLPFLFLFGLLLIPIGLWRDRRQRRKRAAAQLAGEPPPEEDPIAQAFRTAVGNKSARRRILFVMVATLVNILLFSVAGQKAVSYMDSPKFCGTTCHTVMQPEWEAYNRSAHSRVTCVQCHIGPGASWAVKAKVNGLHQVWAVATNSYQRPVPTPVEHLRPSRDTCEQCHWPEKFTGNKLKLFPHYKSDKTNTPAFNAILLRVGGQNPKTKKYEGIHWHVAQNEQVRYEYRDRERLKIGKITIIEGGKVKRVYEAPGAPVAALGERILDCVDCHNRPTHVYDASPRAAVDRALYEGMLDPAMPHIAEVAQDLLARPGIGRDDADAFFRKALVEAYRAKPDVQVADEALAKASSALGQLYRANVFPAMNVTWRTYRTHLGHQGAENETVGCFRCHDKEHEAKLPDGSTKTLSQSCDNCHEQLAVEEDPAKFDETLQAILPRSE